MRQSSKCWSDTPERTGCAVSLCSSRTVCSNFFIPGNFSLFLFLYYYFFFPLPTAFKHMIQSERVNSSLGASDVCIPRCGGLYGFICRSGVRGSELAGCPALLKQQAFHSLRSQNKKKLRTERRAIVQTLLLLLLLLVVLF